MTALETLHIVCAVLWLGNFVVTGFWSIRAWRTGTRELRAFAAREILVTDVVFTLAFGSAVTASGFALAAREGVSPLATAWTRAALEVLAASGVLWIAVLLPLEVRMRRLARHGSEASLARAFAWWNVVGWSITAALFAVIYLMVGKPT